MALKNALFGGFKTLELAIADVESDLVSVRKEIARLTGKALIETPQLPPRADGPRIIPRTLEARLEKDRSDLAVALAEYAELAGGKGAAASPGTARAPASRPQPASAVASIPPQAPPASPAARTAPAALTPKQKIEAAFAKARAIADPWKRSLAFADARRLMKSLSQ
jgi:hypothetical protein